MAEARYELHPIGLHTVRIVEIDGTRIRVRNLGALNRTPIVDIKPVLGDWCRTGHVECTPET